MRPRALLRRLQQGQMQNVSFRDAEALLRALGFEARDIEGSHRTYFHREVDELVNLQERQGEAKDYQLRQIIRLVERYGLRIDD